VAGVTPTENGLLLFQFSTLFAAFPCVVFVTMPRRELKSHGNRDALFCSTSSHWGAPGTQHHRSRVSVDE
jgi:hypothetical protein